MMTLRIPCAWQEPAKRVESKHLAWHRFPSLEPSMDGTRTRRGFRVLPWLRARWLKLALRVLLGTPLAVRIVAFTVAVVAVWSAVNWAYHVIRKPTELFFLVNRTFAKTPPE